MSSIGHALATADAVRRYLDCESKDPKYRAVTPAEIAEGRAQKEKVLMTVGELVGNVLIFSLGSHRPQFLYRHRKSDLGRTAQSEQEG